jgi:DNA-binding MarR family transcriptional regulator
VADLTDRDELTLKLLNTVRDDADATQRSIANELGIALGLTNAYLKRCVKKGLIKVGQAPANRFKYYLTPKGFMEKSRLTAEFLTQSFNLFRYAREETARLYRHCNDQGWQRLVLIGASDFSEIAIFGVQDTGLDVAVYDPRGLDGSTFCGAPVVADLKSAADQFDAAIICDYTDAPSAYKSTLQTFPAERILVPSILDVADDQDDRNAGPSRSGGSQS